MDVKSRKIFKLQWSVKKVNTSKASTVDWSIDGVKFFQNQVASKENLFDKTAKDLDTKEPLVLTVYVYVIVTELVRKGSKKVKLKLFKEKTNMDIVVLEFNADFYCYICQ